MTRRRKIQLVWIGLSSLILAIFIFLLFRPNPFYQTTVTEPDQETIDEVLNQAEGNE